MTRIRVALDACVLLPYQLSDLLLRLAEAELYEPLWSVDILEEVQRNLVARFGLVPARAAQRVTRMQAAFPNAVVEDYEPLLPAMDTHPKERHVAAPAVRGAASILVTANTRDFPSRVMTPFDVEVLHPDDFLQLQFDMFPTTTLECLQRERKAYARPQFTFSEFYLALHKTVPNFAKQAAAAERQFLSPLVEPISVQDAYAGLFSGTAPDPSTPLGAAFLWWISLSWSAVDDVRQFLTHNPTAWQVDAAKERLAHYTGIMQFVERCPDDDAIAYVKFMQGFDYPARLDDEPDNGLLVLTMVRYADGIWRAWGLTENYFPTSCEVKGIER